MLLDSVQKRMKVNNSVCEKTPLTSSSLLQQRTTGGGGHAAPERLRYAPHSVNEQLHCTARTHARAGRQAASVHHTHADPK